MTSVVEPRPPGRPRDPAVHDAILHATLELVSTEGEAGLIIDRIAERAGVSKATIYRRWASKDDVLLAAVDRLSSEVPAPDTGDLRQDLLAIAGGLATLFTAPTAVRLVSTLVAQMATRPDLATALRRGFLADRRRAARDALTRADGRGDLRAGVDLEVAVDLLASPFYYRLLITGDPVDGTFAGEVVAAVVGYVTPAAS